MAAFYTWASFKAAVDAAGAQAGDVFGTDVSVKNGEPAKITRVVNPATGVAEIIVTN